MTGKRAFDLFLMREIVGHFAGVYPDTGSPCSGSAAGHQGR
ncbi:hypothetical protein Agau_C200933 [Agrobacterium tumefaciens F2]|nr:hypothetical protein Agau_C200933 [Agrobacterium tumefaciens F2]